MIRSPRHPQTFGKTTLHMAESLDFYRTLSALAMGSKIATDVEDSVEGTDLSPHFEDLTKMVKNHSFSQMARCPKSGLGPESACNSVARVRIAYMVGGLSVVADRTQCRRLSVGIHSATFTHLNNHLLASVCRALCMDCCRCYCCWCCCWCCTRAKPTNTSTPTHQHPPGLYCAHRVVEVHCLDSLQRHDQPRQMGRCQLDCRLAGRRGALQPRR